MQQPAAAAEELKTEEENVDNDELLKGGEDGKTLSGGMNHKSVATCYCFQIIFTLGILYTNIILKPDTCEPLQYLWFT